MNRAQVPTRLAPVDNIRMTRIEGYDSMIFNSNKLTKKENLDKVKADLEILLPDMFDNLNNNGEMKLHGIRSHHDYVEFLNKRLLSEDLDTEALDSNWLASILKSRPHTKDVYEGACYQLVILRWAENAGRLDEDLVGELTVNMGLMVNALHGPRTTEISSLKKISTEKAKAGGLGRARNYAPAKEKLVELLNTNAPATGWKSRVEAINAIAEPLGQFIEEEKIHLEFDALIATVGRWARNEPKVAAAFEQHVNTKRKSKSDLLRKPERM